MKRLSTCVFLVLSAICMSANAQVPAAKQQVQRDIDPNSLAGAGLQAIQVLDGERAGELWDGGSQVAKRTTSRADFVSHVAALRKPLGTVVSRAWSTVHRQQVAGGAQLPQGQYASVEFVTSFSAGKVGRELVSFRLDEDGVWRFTGYVLK